MFKTLEDLIEIIRSRKNATKDKSYTNQLLNNKTLSKEKTEEVPIDDRLNLQLHAFDFY